ncbi:MAG: hypothetical protein ACI81Q_002308, partial [Paracoccaceae bacterium]
ASVYLECLRGKDWRPCPLEESQETGRQQAIGVRSKAAKEGRKSSPDT